MIYPVLSELAFQIGRHFPKRESWFSKVLLDRRRWSTFRRDPSKPVIWMHAASLGEFEMGRPILELFLDRHPNWTAVVTFFSPSGFEPRSQYPKAQVFYLPVDAPSEVRSWLDHIQPKVAVFVRYDLWPNHMAGLCKRDIPVVVLGMSAKVRPWYLHPALPLIRKKFLKGVAVWGVVDARDADVLAKAGLSAQVLGNPKYDYAAGLLDCSAPEKYKAWKRAQKQPVLLVGSAHLQDMDWVNGTAESTNFSIWVVPHKIEESAELVQCFREQGCEVSYASLDAPKSTAVLVVDEFGVLASLYSLADGVVVGGGFGKSTHNVLEATAAGKVAGCGPNWERMPENESLVQRGFLVPGEGSEDLKRYLDRAKEGDLVEKGEEARRWLKAQSGTQKKMVSALEQAVQL